MKRLPMLLIPCIAISATAATFNAQGKIINSKDAENPGIVKFEKDKIATTKNNLKKPTALAKIEPMTNVIHVTPYEGRFSTNNNSYSLILNGNNLNISTQQQYINTINTLETLDEPRNRGLGFGESNSGYPYSYSNGSDCRITSTSYNYNAFFNDVYTDILNGLHFNPGTTPTHSCTGTYSNTCGNGINIYNVVADRHPITFNGNSCKITDPNDARHALNYSYRIQHYNVNQFFSVASPNASLYTVAEREARSDGHFMTDKFPWHFFNSQETINKAPHIINIIASSNKDVSLYKTEAANIDDYIYYTRAISFAAYTEEGKKTGPGTALNAITVSPANSDGYVLKRDFVPEVELLENNSQSRIAKPDIYSLSYAYNSNNDFSRKIIHDNGEYDILGITDSWGASTTAAAMAADLLSKYPFYKWHPELVKALMLTANNRENLTKVNYNNINEITPSNITNGSVKHTKSLTLFDEMVRNNVSRYWYGNNNDFFYEDKMSFTENVDHGGKYNIAIAWLVQGHYAYHNNNFSSTFNFTIYDNATGKKLIEGKAPTARISTNRYVTLDVPTNVSKIKVEITRYRNTGDRVILGFNMHKVTQ